MTEIHFTDRYQALGMDYPNPETMCPGQCEGTGWYPEGPSTPATTMYEEEAWRKAHAESCSLFGRIRIAWKYRDLPHLWRRCDGYHFIKCPDCGGTGKLP